MLLDGKTIDDVTRQDLEALVENDTIEAKRLDFKRQPPEDGKAKKSLLKAVSSFANTDGGWLIIGVDEQEDQDGNRFLEFSPLTLPNRDDELLRMNNLLRDTLDPRIPVVELGTVDLDPDAEECAIVIRVERSFNAPHRVTYRGHNEFYARTSNGSHPMDVDELRAAFLQSETFAERATSFRAERIEKIQTDTAPMPLSAEQPTSVLHFMPYTAFQAQTAVHPPELPEDVKTPHLYIPPDNTQHNLDGILHYSDGAYTQLFRNGHVEMVDQLLLGDQHD